MIIIAVIIAIILIILAVLLILSMSGRVGHRGLEALRGWRYAHRGLYGNGVPENSMAAFRKALEGGYGIELDVHLLKDGNLAVIHDASLKRTAGAAVLIEDLTAEDLQNYPLEGTEETIPLLQDVLALYAGKAPIILELKAERGNCAALTETACRMMEDSGVTYCMESFDPRCVRWLKQNKPHIVRGQLSENYFRSKKSKLPVYLKLALSNHLLNFLTQPDFIACRYSDRNLWSTKLCRSLWGLESVTWTVQSRDELDTAEKEGWISIFESFAP